MRSKVRKLIIGVVCLDAAWHAFRIIRATRDFLDDGIRDDDSSRSYLPQEHE